jgi:4-aminobutyrate aminotransferase-like enzyme
MQYKGNLVSLAVAEAVLRVVEEEGLVAHARELGGYILSQLSLLANKHPCIGDVRSVHPLEETFGIFCSHRSRLLTRSTII